VSAVNQMAVTRDYNKPLQEEEPYLVQVSPDLLVLGDLRNVADFVE
jgi:hypothetical protein